MTKIKLCGIRREIDIEYANKYLPDYIGFVFAKSRRQVSSDDAMQLISNLNPDIKTVGVFVNEQLDKVVQIADQCRLNVVQIHGDETPGYISLLKQKLTLSGFPFHDGCCKYGGNTGEGTAIWKVIRVRNIESIKEMKCFNADAFILDTYTEGSFGGAGKSFDWKLAAEASNYGKIILAGGLNPENIKDAVIAAKPYAVDVSSGVETEGFKDEEKTKRFIYSVRCNAY